MAYLAQVLAEHCGLDHQERKYLLIASMLHEIGTIPLKDALTNLVFEKEDYCVAGWVFAELPNFLKMFATWFCSEKLHGKS